MAVVTLTVNATGTPDTEDRRAFKRCVEVENARRATLGLSLLPSSTANERKASYEIIMGANATALHAINVAQAIEVVDQDPEFKSLRGSWAEATPQQKAAAIAALPSAT